MNKGDHGEIARRAYAIWEREGRPQGRHFEHWLKAEREMQAQEPSRQPAPAVPAKTPRKTARKPKKTLS